MNAADASRIAHLLEETTHHEFQNIRTRAELGIQGQMDCEFSTLPITQAVRRLVDDDREVRELLIWMMGRVMGGVERLPEYQRALTLVDPDVAT